MKVKTSRNLVSSLKGSAFRRATCDAKYWWVRHIVTMGTLGRTGSSQTNAAGPPW
jgi:hypothetical protein